MGVKTMDRRKFLGALALAALGLTAGAATPAAAQQFGRWEYQGYRYYDGRDSGERRRRDILRRRLFWMAERTRNAERQGFLSRGQAGRLYDDLDGVRDFLRNDRYLTESEFYRRMRDLDAVEDDLQDAFRRRNHRYDRFHDSRWTPPGHRANPGRGGYGDDRYSRGPGGYGDDRYDRGTSDRGRGRRDEDDDDRYYRR